MGAGLCRGHVGRNAPKVKGHVLVCMVGKVKEHTWMTKALKPDKAF